jgi:hypothetical protein
MATPPLRDEIAGTPTNAEAKAGFGKLWDYVTGLLGLTGDAEQARNALGLGNPMGFKNRLMNAQGLINQRGYISGTATSVANQYTVDRWRVVTSGQNLTFSTTTNEVTFTAPAGGVEQVIEGLNLESGTYTLSWTGTATATVGGTSVSNGGQVTVVGGTNTTVRFIGGTFKYPQLEKGSTATSFDYRPYGTELALCQRYFTKFSGDDNNGGYAGMGAGFCATTTAAFIYHALPVAMRSSPAVAQNSLRIQGVASNPAVTGISNSQMGIQSGYVVYMVASGLIAGNGATLSSNASTSGYLTFSAEL